jgi:hypothetical protein
MPAAIDHVEARHRQPGRDALGSQEPEERHASRGSHRPGGGHRHTDDGIRAQAPLGVGAVEVDQQPIDRSEPVEAPARERVSDLAVDVPHRPSDPRAAKASGIAVAQLDRFTGPCRRAGRHPGDAHSAAGQGHSDRQCGSTARAEDLLSTNGRDLEGHGFILSRRSGRRWPSRAFGHQDGGAAADSTPAYDEPPRRAGERGSRAGRRTLREGTSGHPSLSSGGAEVSSVYRDRTAA